MLAALTGAVHLMAVLAFALGLLIILMASAPRVSAQDLKAINRVYLISGSALLVAALAGTVLWLAGGKPVEFYSNNPVFHAKLGLFVLLLAVLVYTGLQFRQLARTQPLTSEHTMPERDDEASIVVKDSIRRIQKICIPLTLVIPALAWMMARGIGY